VNQTAGFGNFNSYDQRFPNMTGLTYNGSSLIIDNGYLTETRTLTNMREWVANTYTPNTVANGTGWAANGFNDPAGWF